MKFHNHEPIDRQGSRLSPACRAWALSHFVNRFTMEHKPKWAWTPSLLNRQFLPQFRSDQEWLEGTRFFCLNSGLIDRSCNWVAASEPTWPLGKFSAPDTFQSNK